MTGFGDQHKVDGGHGPSFSPHERFRESASSNPRAAPRDVGTVVHGYVEVDHFREGSVMSSKLRFLAVVAVAAAARPAPVAAQQSWAHKMFAEQKHEFGVVARGAEVVHLLRLKNIYEEPVHISNVKTACGCTAAEASKTTLASGEEATIRIEMDTKRFTKKKESSVIVTFDRPLVAEVRIPVSVYIRTDVVITPGSANFGEVEVGKSHTTKVDVAYAGRSDWTIKGVKTLGDHLEAKVVETSREGQAVNYEVHFKLKETAPIGAVRQEVQIETDDANAPLVPLLVEARVEADVTVTPPILAMGRVTPGQVVRRSVVLRGKSPFRIEKIECETDMAAFATKLPDQERPVQVLPLTFTAPDRPGDFVEEFTLTIPGRDEPIVFKAYGTIAKN